MKQGNKASRCLLISLLLVAVVFSAFAGEKTINLVSEVIEHFDDPPEYSWKLFPSKFGIDGAGKELWEMRYVRAWPNAIYRRAEEDPNRKSLGIHGSFLRKAYNYLEIIPGTGEGDDFKAVSIKFPGRIQLIDMWVWGSNHNYYLEAHVRDYRGMDHVLPLGDLNFIGWKNLSVNIPNAIPQQRPYPPIYQGLVLTKLVIWTRPEEKVDDFYIYFDQFKVLTDRFEQRFDGDELAEDAKVSEIWGSGTN